MEDSPYSEFVRTMRECAGEALPMGYRIGKVLTPKPLTVDINGAVQDTGALIFITPAQDVSVTVSSSSPENHSHTARVSDGLPGFSRGDSLLLIPFDDDQRYIVMGRLVGL
jgi:hypothetical protein